MGPHKTHYALTNFPRQVLMAEKSLYDPAAQTGGGCAPDPRFYRGTSLIRNTPLLGPYCRSIPRFLWWS